jgi:hypothetical protein
LSKKEIHMAKCYANYHLVGEQHLDLVEKKFPIFVGPSKLFLRLEFKIIVTHYLQKYLRLSSM